MSPAQNHTPALDRAAIGGPWANAVDQYAGEYTSAAEFAESLHEETGAEVPESLRYYIDWQALARDMVLGGEIMVFQTGFDEVHVFWSR